MKDNVFLEDQKKFGLADYMNFDINGREHMGSTVPLAVYRLLEYSVREELTERFGREIRADIFRCAGRRAGRFFAETMLDMTLSYHAFMAQLQAQMAEMKIGVLRIEKYEEKQEKWFLQFLRMRIAPVFRCWENMCVILMRVLLPRFCQYIQGNITLQKK